MESSTLARAEVGLCAGWSFLPERASRHWLAGRGSVSGAGVHLPHTWNDRDTFQHGVEYRRGPGSYRCRFTFPPDHAGNGGIWRLESEGFYGTGELFFDGTCLGNFDAQYIGFQVDVTPYLCAGDEHVLGIRLTNRCRSDVLPGIAMPDFVLYGGLAGRVRLRRMPELSVSAEDTWIRTDLIREDRAGLIFRTCVQNRSGAARTAEVRWTVLDPAGEPVLVRGSLPQRIGAGLRAAFLEKSDGFPSPRLWDVEDPALYRLRVEVVESDVSSDVQEISFGIRQVRIEGGKGCILNGRRIELRGCNRHESIPGLGNALSPGLHRRDAELLQETGCNFVRLSHYPQHPAFLHACDELGILVYAEIATWKSVRGGRWLQNARRQLASMIRRDRNHPSVFLWGLGNESRKRGPYEELSRIVRDLDPTRQTIYAENHLHRGRRHKTLAIPDVLGVNYEIDHLPQAVKASNHGAVLVSECSSYPTRRGDREAETAQLEKIERDRGTVFEHQDVAGFALWCFSDYGTLRKKRYTRYSGIFDAWRIPKRSAWRFRAAYGSAPFAKLLGSWGCAPGSATRRIELFTNLEAVDLFAGNEFLGTVSQAGHHVAEIPFRPEPLEARRCHGGEAADRLLPWEAARSIQLISGRDTWPSDEIAWIDVVVVDGKGIPALDHHAHVEVQAAGPGAVCSHLPEDRIEVIDGVGRVYLRGMGEAGVVEVVASSSGLEEGRKTIRFLHE